MSAATNIQPKTAPKLLKKRQKHSRWFVAAVVFALLFIEAPLQRGPLFYALVNPLGVILIALCIVGRSYCSAFIGGVKNDVLMREGPFSVVRNPLYVFSFIGLAGIGLLSGMLTLTAGFLLAFIVYYQFVVAREEAFLLKKFGDGYQAYLREVPRWWPKWSLWHEPEQITVRPKFLRQTMADALIFLLPLPCFALLHILHAQGLLPVLLWLP